MEARVDVVYIDIKQQSINQGNLGYAKSHWVPGNELWTTD